MGEGRDEKTGLLSGRTAGSLVVLFPGGEEKIGSFTQVKVTEARGFSLRGRETGANGGPENDKKTE